MKAKLCIFTLLIIIVICFSTTTTPNSISSKNSPDNCLLSNKSSRLYSSNQRAFLNMQSDGNFVLYDCNNNVKWNVATNLNSKGPYKACMQQDGNFVVSDANGRSLWSSNTVRSSAYFTAVMQDDGNFAIYDDQNVVDWASNTSISSDITCPTPATAPVKCPITLPNCLTCSSQTLCTSCIKPTILYAATCVTECPEGTFNDGSSNKCIKFTKCPEGYFFDIASTTPCMPCMSKCTVCTNKNSCQKCDGSVTLNGAGSMNMASSSTIVSGSASLTASLQSLDISGTATASGTSTASSAKNNYISVGYATCLSAQDVATLSIITKNAHFAVIAWITWIFMVLIY
jgi:hypothetical protein